MRVLVVFPHDGQTDKALVDAFAEQGHDVFSHCATREPATMHTKIISHNGEFDLVLMSRTVDLYPSFVIAKQRYPDIKFAIWNVDTRKTLDEWGFLVNFVAEVDYYFTVALGVVERWKTINPNTYWVSQGAQKEKYHEVIPTQEQQDEYLCDVSFIGNCIDEIHTDRRYLLETLRTSHYDFKHFQGVYDSEHNAAVACSRVNLGISHSPEIEYYTSVRTWKVLAAGGILLEQYHKGLSEMFGDRVVLYKNPTDCIAKIGDILGNYEFHKENANKLQEWTLASQCYKDRVDQIMGIITEEKK